MCNCSRLVSKSITNMLKQYETLLQLSSDYHAALEDQYNLYVFERETRDLKSWLISQKTLAESDDFGQDLEDVEVLYMLIIYKILQQWAPVDSVNKGRACRNLYRTMLLLKSCSVVIL